MQPFLRAVLFAFLLGGETLFATAQITVTQIPPLIRQPTWPGEPRVSAVMTLSNIGDASSVVTLGQEGSFFTQTPTSFVLEPGGSQVVTVTAGNEGANLEPRVGASVPAGDGVPAGLRIPIRILFVPLMAIIGESDIKPETTRIEVSGPAGTNPAGTVTYRNSGVGNRAYVHTDVPWIETSVSFDIGDDGTAQVPFNIIRSLRPDGNRPFGSMSGSISLTYQTETGLKGPYSTYVTVVDTVVAPPIAGTPPAIAPGEIVLFIPGVGNVVGSGGKHFLSDLSILNGLASASQSVRLFYRGSSGAQLAAPSTDIAAAQSLALGDVVKSVFGATNEVGSLQARGATASLAVNANVFNVSNPSGTYGTTIPVFRSDRAAFAGTDPLVITGVKRDAQSHTNLYLQEAAGLATTVAVEVLAPDGTVVRTIQESLGAFTLRSINDVVAEGATTIRVRVLTGGAIAAYATPVDDASGDTWAVADWNRFFATSGTEPRIIPVAGSAPGANDTYFRTDLALSSGASDSTATLSYYPQSGGRVDRSVTLGRGKSAVYGDVVASLFGVTPPSLGHIVITPGAGATLSATSRTYTTLRNSAATFGTAIPPIPRSVALRSGSQRLFAAIDEAALSTISHATPGTYRTNFGLVETAGKAARVRVSLRFFNGRDLAAPAAPKWREYDLAPNQMILVPRILSAIVGESRETVFGDMRSIIARFEIVGGEGEVVPFVTTTDNGTGDTVFRMQ